ncbi:MAG: hypothetical protein FIB07_17370 [Candidatus Methanoperedens sp.]|nr:hypothetical protein [Candidatus Methanoperedens sp.]
MLKIMLISDNRKNRKQIGNDRNNHQTNRHYLIAVIIFALVFFSSQAYATEVNSSHDHNASSSDITNTTNSSTGHIHLNSTTNSSLHVHPDANLSVAFLMKGAAEQIKVNIEDFGTKNPISSEPHGSPVRFFKANAQNISYEILTINVSYPGMELNGIDEEELVIFRHEHNNSTWIMLPTKVNKEGKTLEATTDSLSLFAVSSHSGNSSAHNHNNTSEIDGNTSHDHADKELMPISVSFTGPGNTKIALELDSRNSSNAPLPGRPIKFFRINARNLSYNKVNIEVAYPDSGLNGADENNLSIFHYANSTWTKLPTEVNEDENTLMASVESLSLFAISSFFDTGHNITGHNMGMGIVSQCLRCHGSSTNYSGGMMGETKINENILNLSIHAGLNNASSDLNRACWACHSNSTTPPVKHPMHNPALTCTSCHITGKFDSLRTTEHTTHATNITVNATCELCHGKSQMINLNGSTLNSTISHYGKKRTDMIDQNKTSTNCSYCHQSPGSEFSDVFSKASRTNITHNGGVGCSSCHGTGRLHDTTLVNMRGYNLSNCVQCHGKSGFALNKVDENALNQSIHANLNNASSSLNRACWTCHSNIITAPEVHPNIARQPNTCSTCHIEGALNLTKKLKPNHLTRHTPESSQLKVAAACTICHSNDALASGRTVNSTVYHYARYPEADTKDCVSCHQNKEFGKRWGSPPDPRETLQLANVEKKLVSDETWKLNQNYSIAVSEVDKEGQSVWLELYYNGKLVQKELVPEGGSFTYDAKLVEEGDNKTIIDLGISDIYYGGTVSLVTFSGAVPKHIHTETSSIQCYACHVRDYRPGKPDGYRFFVLKNEEQNITLNQLDIDFSTGDKKTMYSGESWDLGSGYELRIKDFSRDRAYVLLALLKNDIVVKEEFVREGDDFTYNTTSNGVEVTMLSLKISGMFVNG